MKKLVSLMSVVAFVAMVGVVGFSPGISVKGQGAIVSAAYAGYNHKKPCAFKAGCKYKTDKNCFGSMACGPRNEL